MDFKYLKIVVQASNREEAVYIHNLRELASWIDDFATDHCEGSCQLYMFFDGEKKLHPVNIFCEVEK